MLKLSGIAAKKATIDFKVWGYTFEQFDLWSMRTYEFSGSILSRKTYPLTALRGLNDKTNSFFKSLAES